MRRIVTAAILVAVSTSAFAQAQTRRPALTGNPIKDIGTAIGDRATSTATASASNAASILAKPFQDLAEFLSSDAEGAIALSTQIPDLKDGHGQQCWIAMAKSGEVFKAHPIPLTLKAMTDFEALRLLAISANNLCANVHCTQVFADATTMAQAASPVPLIIPSLHDLCSKIPQIGVVPPVDFTPAPTPVTTPAPSPPASTNP